MGKDIINAFIWLDFKTFLPDFHLTIIFYQKERREKYLAQQQVEAVDSV